MGTGQLTDKLIVTESLSVRISEEYADKKRCLELLGDNVPVLFKEAATKWPAMNLWSFEYLEEQFVNQRVICERVVEGHRVSEEFLIAEYIDYIRNTGESNPFYLGNCQIHLGTELEDHYRAPVFAHCWYKNFVTDRNKYALSWLFIGPENSWSILHVDRWNTSAWNAVIKGVKLWLFYDSSQAEYLYGGKVNPFEPDIKKYPAFQKAKPIVCLQKSGDIVFTPSGWWHAVKNLEKGISITENFINETNYEKVESFFVFNNRPNSVKTLKSIREKALNYSSIVKA
jgi:histone arginine demethylase JMJD6